MAEWKCLTERRWCNSSNMCKECAEAEDRREMARLRGEAAKPAPERIAAALALADICDKLEGSTTLKDRKDYEERLQAYRATAPKLRTRAEVDAEIADWVRGAHFRGSGSEVRTQLFADKLSDLCSEPTAHEPVRGPCPCGNTRWPGHPSGWCDSWMLANC